MPEASEQVSPLRYTQRPLRPRARRTLTATPVSLPGLGYDSGGPFTGDGRETILHFANGVRLK